VNIYLYNNHIAMSIGGGGILVPFKLANNLLLMLLFVCVQLGGVCT